MQEASGAQGALGEKVTAGRPVRQLEPFTVTEKIHRVIADDVAPAQREEPELVGLALAGAPLALALFAGYGGMDLRLENAARSATP